VSLSVQNLSYSFGTRKILHDLTFSAAAGEVLGVAGPNGCGKTTLIKCIDRIFEPEGIVQFAGKDIGALTTTEVARMIAYVPQALTVGMAMTVFETILLGRRPYIRWSVNDADFERVNAVITDMGIQHLAFRKMTQISGGERQKVMIARAMVQDPELLLLDEPTSALDLRHQLEVMELVRKITRENQTCVLMAIHDLNLASRFCDRLMIMKEGRIFALGDPADLLNQELIQEVYEVEARITTESGYLQIVPVRSVQEQLV
jgi:ABC-type cobalamin/Fe3+-siderophores transport system ATPase subunit